jgi:hypothetical protein
VPDSRHARSRGTLGRAVASAGRLARFRDRGPAGAAPALDTIDFHVGIARANNAILGLFGAPARNVTVASGFSVGTADLVIDVTVWWR